MGDVQQVDLISFIKNSVDEFRFRFDITEFIHYIQSGIDNSPSFVHVCGNTTEFVWHSKSGNEFIVSLEYINNITYIQIGSSKSSMVCFGSTWQNSFDCKYKTFLVPF